MQEHSSNYPTVIITSSFSPCNETSRGLRSFERVRRTREIPHDVLHAAYLHQRRLAFRARSAGNAGTRDVCIVAGMYKYDLACAISFIMPARAQVALVYVSKLAWIHPIECLTSVKPSHGGRYRGPLNLVFTYCFNCAYTVAHELTEESTAKAIQHV